MRLHPAAAVSGASIRLQKLHPNGLSSKPWTIPNEDDEDG